ncbi:response regulator [Ruficoccus sp. ZRK36]|uniref:response regulator n=1 Tax=Ruficoccus sp. ZRK36 TaxID=2866311 RepID=UPI001C72FBDC|nr:response regulator [Ruficoccus sp. ZRK36]QYY35935.1 response regulator [Ruficoccus sp. ZRK36]
MGKRILILDDDSDFNNLLTDIFSQADYEVVSEQDPEKAVELFRGDEFDLVVTDQKMPGLTGEEFIREIKRLRPEIPVIMVSGYLDNDTIRNLIREGVGGVFLKPLNVFSLLKRTSALIESSQNDAERQATGQGTTETDAGEFEHGLSFSFESYPCRASASLEFAKKLYGLRGFKNNLVLIGEDGTDLASLLEDIRGFDEQSGEAFASLELSQLNEATLLETVKEAQQAGANRLTLMISRPDQMDYDQTENVYAAARKKGPFLAYSLPVRYIFFVNEDIDTLYDSGRVDDNLYMFFGTSEARVPPLREIRDDLPLIARREVASEAARLQLDSVPSLLAPAASFLREREWSSGMLGFKRVVRAAVAESKGDPISRELLEKICANANASRTEEAGNLKHMLQMRRDDYLKAVYRLSGNQVDLTAEVLGVDASMVDATVSPASDPSAKEGKS